MDSEQQYDVSESDSEYDSDDSQEDPTFDLMEETRSSLSKLSIRKQKPKDMSARYNNFFDSPKIGISFAPKNDNEIFIFCVFRNVGVMLLRLWMIALRKSRSLMRKIKRVMKLFRR